jgi:hypothetical protein
VNTEATCAFAECQVGGDILDGAPRMGELVLSTNPPDAWFVVDEYHPGCWDAEQRRDQAPSRAENVRLSTRRTDA